MKIVKITWVDSALHGQDAKFDDSDFGLLTLTSVGIVAKETDKYITLAMDYTSECKWWRSTASYPKFAIKNIETLYEDK